MLSGRPRGHRIDERHPILGQRPGLVGANHGCRAKGLDCGEVSDHDVAAGHALGPHGEGQGHGGQESLGDIRHDDPDREQQVLCERQRNRQPDQKKHNSERCGEEEAAPAEPGGGGLAPICDAPGTYVYDR